MKLGRSLTGLSLLGLSLIQCVGAYSDGKQKPLPNFDKRPRQQAPSAEARVEQRLALTRLQERAPGIKVEFDDVLGTPRFITSANGFLTGPGGKGGTIGAATLEAFPENDPHRIVKSFLRQHAQLFGHGPEVLTAARTVRDDVTAHSSLRTVIWEQHLDDIAVFEGRLIGHITRRGELVNLSSRFIPALAEAANMGTGNRIALVARPVISAPEAIVLAAENIDARVIATDIIPLAQDAEGAEKRQSFRADPLKGETRVRLIWLPMNRFSLRLCWQVELTSRARGELYRVLIDAQSGDALIRHCLTFYLSEATYRVFISDSPTPFSPGYRTPSSVQPAAVERQLVTLSALSTNASPNGWINDGGNELRGNNVDAHLDRNDDDQADLPRPQGAPQRVFDFPMALDQAPASYGNATVTQLFYWNNWMHDKLYELGFTEAAGNFQKTNFDRGGVGNDAVEADAQDGGGFNNANFSASSDGIPGRMQMYLFDGPSPDRDGSLDVEIVLHEYTHGLSTRLVGGGDQLNELQSAGMGEGWSDFYALALLSESADELDGDYAMGAYASYQIGHLNENYYYGIRRYPYTTELTRNPLTFKDLDSRQADRHAGVPLSPLSGAGDFAEEVHNQGEVWCVTLWDARANLIKKWGFEIGNQLILQLVTDGMKLTPPNPNFLEARDAILQADRVKTAGANREELWAAFAKRGMGFNATSPRSSTTSGVGETFDVPDDLQIAPFTGLTSTGPDGGPFSPMNQSYSLSNVGTNVIEWSAAWTAAWLDLSITNGTLQPGAVPITLTAQLTSIVNSLPAGLYDDTITITNHVSGKSQARKVALRVGQPDPFTSLFADEDNDLDFQTITFTPDGSKDYYSVCRETATAFPTDPSAGAILSLADDDFAKVVLSDGAHVSLYGTNYTSFYVSANGSVTFTQGVSEFQESLEAHFSLPRISMLFDDLDPSFDGLVSWTQLPDLVAVTFENVPNFFEANQNSFQLEMFFDGRIRLTYLEIGSTGGLIGLSDGQGLPAGFVETNFKSYGACLPVLSVNLPASVTEAQPGVTGTIVLPQPLTSDLVVNLQSSDAAELTVPATLTIPRGETVGQFPLGAADDNELNGTRAARISASAEGFRDGTARIQIHDNETGRLTVELPPQAKEGDGLLRGQARVTLDLPATKNVVIGLSSSDTAEIETSKIVVIPAGQTSATFDLTVVDDLKIDGPSTAVVTAHVENWQDGSASISVLDNERKEITVSLKRYAGEGNGVVKDAGSVGIPGTLVDDLTVSLVASDASELIVPAVVVIPKNQTVAKFDLTIIDDPEVDGPKTVSVTASAAGFSSGTASLIINDNETPPMPVAPFPAHLSTNNSPAVSLSWSTGEGEILVNGGFESGDFSGWVKVNTDAGGFVINDGTLDPDGPEDPVPPLTGQFAAVSQQIGAGRNVIYQEVTISAGAISATLSWSDRIRNQASIFVDPDQEFRVEIRSTDDQVLAIAYSTDPGDTLLNDWTNRSFDLAQFVGQTIRIAFVEEDSLGFFNVHLDNISVVLGTSGQTTYDVFFGPKPQIDINDFQGRVATNRFALDKLYIDATYYWQVVAKRGTAQAIGPIWQFSVPGIGPVDHFGWNAVASPQSLDQPFPVTVVAQDAFDNTATNFAGVVGLSGRVEFPDTTLGVGTESWDFPLGGFFPDSRIQVIYPVSEVGSARRITSLAVSVVNTRTLPATRFTIRMKHTALRGYSAAPAWERAGWTTVYQKNQSVNDRGWIVFELTTPFDYDGTSSLMIDFSYKGAGFSTGGQCRYSVTSEPRSISYQSFGDFGDPLIWTGSTSPAPDVDSKAPNILLTAVNPVAITPLTSGNFVNGVWTGEVTVNELVARLALRADDGEGHFGQGNIFDLQARDDLSVAIADSPDPVTAGQDIVYTFVVNNSGPSAATGVVLSNALPANLSLVSATLSQGTFIRTNPAVVGELGTLPGGSNAVLTIVLNTGSFTGSVTNVAQVTRTESEQYLLNNISTAVTMVVARPSISIDDVTVTEGNLDTTNAQFTVRLSGPSSQVITVQYATTEDTALEQNDYVATNGVLTFQPGVTTQNVMARVRGDTVDEPDERFFLTLSLPENASLARAQATASILDDDGPVLSIFDVSVAEGNRGTTNLAFSLLLDRPSVQPVSVEYATSNGSAASGPDYVETNGIVSFAPGVTNRTITVVVKGDTLVEPNERFFINLFNPTNATIADQQAVGTLVNDDGLPGNVDQFEWTTVPSPQTVNQPFAVTVKAMDAFNRPATNFSGTASLRGEIVYPDANIGDGELPWSEPLGTFFEDSRVQIIYLASEVGAPRLITALSLHVTALPALTLNRWTIRMKQTSLSNYSLTASWERTGWTIVYQQNQNFSATGWVTFEFTKPFDYDGVDNLMIDFSFNNNEFAFPEGECTATETTDGRSLSGAADGDFGDPLNWIGTNPEPIVENQILNVRLSSHVPVAVGRKTSDRFVSGIWTGAMTVEELATGMVLRADDDEGHMGQSNPFDTGVIDDLSVTVADAPDPVTVGRPLTYSITVHNSGPSLSSGVTLTNSLPAGATFVSALSDQGGCFETNGIVVCHLGTVPGGTNVSVVVVVKSPDTATVLTNRASVTRTEVDPYLSNNVALTQTRVNNRPSISISDAKIMEGDSGTTGAVLIARLSVPSSETVTVDYATADGTAEQGTDYIAATGTITFPPGKTNQTVTVQIVGDTNDELEETLFVNLSKPVNATISDGQGICRIIDDDGPVISINKINVAEGNSGTNNAVFTVKLSAASPQTVTVEYSTSDDSAIAGSDYLEAAGKLTFRPGVTNLSVAIRIKGDLTIEPDENFFVNLFNSTNATALASPGIGTILNDDGLPGELDHFEWSTISSLQRVNQPFTTVLFARDALNQPGLNFTGTAQLEAATGNPDSTIGTGTATWTAPLDTSYEMSRVQVIYLAKEVGAACRVTALALNVTGIPRRALSRWTIRMRHTALNSYGSRPVWERTGWATVYQQDQTLEATGWTTFTFTRPFDFNGTNNLMVDFSFKNDDFDFNAGECLSSDTSDARSVSYGTFGFFDPTDDPLTWAGTLPEPDVNLQIPDIRLSTITLVRITPTNSAAFVDGSWIGTFTVDAPGTNVTIRATDVLGHTGESAHFAVNQWTDTDVDGLPDDWEAANRFAPANGRDATEDADDDGLSNAEEYFAGTNPHDSASSVRIVFARINDARPVLSFESVLGRVYRIESSTQPGGALWSVVKDGIPGIGQRVEVTDPEPLGQSNRFYRLRVIP